jgi:crotonobetainyl-CoA:carnitine CoA-transferase CaiB-like acyl-CoA transferase
MNGALEGIKVIEWAHWVVGPLAGSILAELGADVIKIEERTGDRMRGLTHVKGQKIERNWLFEYANRSTRSIAIDLETQKGKEIIYEFIRKADVFLHNFQAGIPEKLGLDYETLSRYNPRLIYAQGSGWGLNGPFLDKPAYAPIMESRSGIMQLVAGPGKPPIPAPGALGDVITSIILVPTILAALLARERLGAGQKIDVSGLGSLIFLQGCSVSNYFIGGVEEQTLIRAQARNPLWNYYQCADGKWMFLAMLQSDRYWPNFCEAMRVKHLEKDPRFENSEARKQNARELISILEEIFSTRPLSEWLEHFEHQWELVYAPVQSIPELVTDPQVIANEYVMDFNHPVYGMIKVLGFPYKFSRTPASVKGPAPELGQHTEEILLEMGYDWEDIVRLEDEGVI